LQVQVLQNKALALLCEENYVCFVCLICQDLINRKDSVAHLVPLKKSLQGGVHKLCFVVFGPMEWELLNFKVFIEWKNKKITCIFILIVAIAQYTLIIIIITQNYTRVLYECVGKASNILAI